MKVPKSSYRCSVNHLNLTIVASKFKPSDEVMKSYERSNCTKTIATSIAAFGPQEFVL